MNRSDVPTKENEKLVTSYLFTIDIVHIVKTSKNQYKNSNTITRKKLKS